MKKTPFVFMLFLLAGLFTAGTFSDSLNNGYTLAPGEGSCGGCHSDNGQNVIGNLQLSGLPTYLASDTWYSISLTLSVISNEKVGGFQMTAVDVSGNNSGTFGNPGANVEITTHGSRNYVQHIDPSPLYLMNNTVTYTFNWKSPVVNEETPAFFYWGAVAGNPDDLANNFDRAFMQNLNRTVVPPVGFASVSHEDVSCFGANDGSATVFSQGGVAPITFQWSNGGTGNSISGLAPGVYQVTATDDIGQTAATSVTIQQPALLTGTVVENQEISCYNENDGILAATPSGGTPPYQFAWSTGANSPVVFELGAGDYQVTITDVNGCTTTAGQTLEAPEELVSILFGQEDVSCPGGADGLLQITATGGVMPYQFNWSNGASGPALPNLPPGDYQLTITDQNGCTDVSGYVISAPPELAIDLISVVPSPAGETNGSIQVEASGGTPPYSFEWEGGTLNSPVEEEDPQMLGPGDYTLTLTDANGCTFTYGPVTIEPLVSTGNISSKWEIQVENPATEKLQVFFSSGLDQPVSYRLWSTQGHLEKTGSIPGKQKTFTILGIQYRGWAILEFQIGQVRIYKRVFLL